MGRIAAAVFVVLWIGAGVADTAAGSDDVDWGGWLSSGIHANAWGAAENGPLGSKSIGNGYTVGQLWGFAEKAVDTEGGGWDLGGRVDYMFGTEASAIQAFGDGSWDARWNTSADYGSAMPQLYAEVGYGDVRVKAGRFLTPIGCEAIEDPLNFFPSNSYSYFYAEPGTHTGLLGSWEASDTLTLSAGWTNGWDAGPTDNGGASTFLGGITCSALENLIVTYVCSAGTLPDGEGELYMHSLGFEVAASERLTWIVQNDLGVQPGRAAGGEALWTGIVQYLEYNLSESLAAGLRFEWFRDRDGTRIDPGQISGNFYELTAGLNWRPIERLILRPELRYDWFAGRYVPGSLPFDDGQESDQISGGFDVIVTF